MSKKEDLTQISNEDLLKKVKMAKVAFLSLFAIILLQVGLSIYITIKQGFGVFSVMPLFFIPILIINRSATQSLEQEKKRRGLQ